MKTNLEWTTMKITDLKKQLADETKRADQLQAELNALRGGRAAFLAEIARERQQYLDIMQACLTYLLDVSPDYKFTRIEGELIRVLTEALNKAREGSK